MELLENLKDRFSLRRLELLMIALVLVTGAIHLRQGLLYNFNLLILAGLGFFGGAVLFLVLREYRDLISLAAIPYTLAQFYYYYEFYGLTFSNIARVDKTVQATFVVAALVYLKRRELTGLNKIKSVLSA